ncbi:MAG TPA: septation regulator SpoVG [bacterium]|nr:septation regulator SpoVG [bacterium]
MQITGITVAPVDEAKLRAYVNITIDNCFMVRGLKIIRGNNGLFVAMPNKKSKNGMFRDIAHPLDSDTRKMIEDRVIKEYEAVVKDGGNGGNGGGGNQSVAAGEDLE